MIYNFLSSYVNAESLNSHFSNILLRSIIAIFFSFISCLIIGPKIINFLLNLQKYGQPIRIDGPESHKSKAGTPTMGGIMIIISVLLTILTLADLTNIYIWSAIFVLVGFSAIGYLDDYAKITKNNHKGISGKTKLILQFSIALIACSYLKHFDYNIQNQIAIPFIKGLFIDLGLFYLPFALVVVVGSSNAVNLTDGLDGLAIVPIVITAGSFGLIAYWVGNSLYANNLSLNYIPGVAEIAILCSSIIGAGLGFLWFNAQPAQVFMGDTGSLSLGATLGIISVMIKQEILLAIIGGLFVCEALSVIIQVYYFKFNGGKRIFKMAPFHHHFERQGWPESKVVIRFWIIAVIFCIIGLSSVII